MPPADTAGPKWERPCGPADSLPTGHPPPCNPAESATLRLHSTSIRNVVTTLGLSARVRAEQGDVPNRKPGEWWDGPSSEGPAVMAGIGRRGPRWLAGSGASRSEHVMSPTDTSRYEWGSPPPREPERGACKLPTHSFPASGRAWTASTADDRGRSPGQGPATEEPCAGKLSCTVCAVWRVVTSLAQPGSTRGRCLGYQLTRGRKANGTRACWEQGVTAGRRCTAGRVRPGRHGEGSIA